MNNEQYSLDDILADAKKIRAKQQLEKQQQTSFQRLDNLGYKKMKIGDTSEISRLVSKTPISDKGKLFYTMQLRKLKEETMRSLERKNAGIDVTSLMKERDIKRKQVLSEVIKLSEETKASRDKLESIESGFSGEFEKPITSTKRAKTQAKKPAVTTKKVVDEKSSAIKQAEQDEQKLVLEKEKTPAPALQKAVKENTYDVSTLDDKSANTTSFVRQQLFKMLEDAMPSAEKQQQTEQKIKTDVATPATAQPVDALVPDIVDEVATTPSEPKATDNTVKTSPKALDMGFVAKTTTEMELQERRIKKATSFVLDEDIFSSITADIPSKKIQNEVAEDEYSEQKTIVTPTIKAERDDFPKTTVPQTTGEVDMFDGEDVSTIKQDIYKNYTKSALSVVAMVFFTVLSLYVSLASELSLPLPDVLNAPTNPFGFICTNIVLITLSILICRTIVFYGIVNLFTLKADNDSLTAMAAIAVLIQNLMLMLSPHSINANIGVNIYTPLAIIGLLANEIGRLLTTTRMVRNVKMTYSASKNKYSTIFLPPDTAQTAMMATSSDEYNVLAPVKTDRFTGFIENSVSEDLSDTIGTFLAPIVFVASLIITLFCYIIYRDINLSLTALSATLCICSPFSALIISNLPLNIISKKLYPVGGIVSGYDALEATADADAIVVSAGDLFPKGTILLHDIKTFEQAKIDDVLLDTASVILRVGGTLQDVFSQIIMNQDSMLADVDSIVYEDSMGVSAWINSKRVLIGNRHLMQNHGVNVPSQAYEQKYKRDNRELVYLSTSGTLAAMFVVSYKADEQIKKALQKLTRTDVSICVKTSDANISADKLAQVFEIPVDYITVMPSEIYRDYTEVTKHVRTSPITTAFLGNVLGYLKAVTACKKARKTIFISTIMQTAGIALGYILVTFFAFMKGLTQIDVTALLIYQLSWFLVSWGIVKFNSY